MIVITFYVDQNNTFGVKKIIGNIKFNRMKTLAFPRGSLLPNIASDIFDARSFFTPGLWNMDDNFADFEFVNRIPNVNIKDLGKEFLIEMAAPGLEKKDFKIEIENGMLMISAEKKEESKEERDSFTRREFSYNHFMRRFRLPEDCHYDKMEAKYENGILKLMLPKNVMQIEKKSKEIKIS